MKLLLICAILCQHVTFWDRYEPIHFCVEESLKAVNSFIKEMDGPHPKYTYDIKAWGASLKSCYPEPLDRQYTILTYFMEDYYKVCHNITEDDE